MTKKELIAALEKYNDEDEVYILCEAIYGRNEQGEEIALYPGICMIDDKDEIDYLGEAYEVIPDEQEYQYFGSGYMA